MLRRVRNPAERFWAKVDKNGPVPAHRPSLGRCWLWQGGRSLCGYGRFRQGRAVEGMVAAHRWSLAQALGRAIRPDHHACHHCDTRLCVRPSHLFEATLQENEADKDAKGRRPRGHRMPPESVRRGSLNERAKLTEADVRTIKRVASKAKRNQSAIARAYGVTPTIISRILSGKIWRHVP